MATVETLYPEDLSELSVVDAAEQDQTDQMLDALSDEVLSDEVDAEKLEARNKLFDKFVPLAHKIAYKKQRDMPRCVSLDELRSAAYVGLLDAASRYDETKHKLFAVYARIRIVGAINDYLRTCTWGGRTRKVYGWSLEVQVQTQHGRQGFGMALEDVVSAKEQMARSESEDFFRHVTRSLPQHVQKMFKLYYLDDLTMKEIGKKFGISEARVSQLLTEYKEFLGKELEAQKEDLFREARPRGGNDHYRLHAASYQE